MKAWISFLLLTAALTSQAQVSHVPWEVIQFDGIAKFENHCSASLIRFHQSLKTDKALLLSNAHCIRVHEDLVPEELKATAMGMDKGAAGHYLVNYDIAPNWVYPVELKNYREGRHYTVHAKHVLYVTRTLTDIVLFELSETFEELEARGFKALTLSERPARIDEPIAIVSGQFNRQFNCNVHGTVSLLWARDTYFTNAIRYSAECPVFRGTSGSPVISKRTGEVVAINSLRNDPKDKNCETAAICEYDKGQESLSRFQSGYATEVHQIYSCLNEKRQIDLNKEGCKLYGSAQGTNEAEHNLRLLRQWPWISKFF